MVSAAFSHARRKTYAANLVRFVLRNPMSSVVIEKSATKPMENAAQRLAYSGLEISYRKKSQINSLAQSCAPDYLAMFCICTYQKCQ